MGVCAELSVFCSIIKYLIAYAVLLGTFLGDWSQSSGHRPSPASCRRGGPMVGDKGQVSTSRQTPTGVSMARLAGWPVTNVSPPRHHLLRGPDFSSRARQAGSAALAGSRQRTSASTSWADPRRGDILTQCDPQPSLTPVGDRMVDLMRIRRIGRHLGTRSAARHTADGALTRVKFRKRGAEWTRGRQFGTEPARPPYELELRRPSTVDPG